MPDTTRAVDLTPDLLLSNIGMLADDRPQVRAAAIQALEKLQPTGEWRRHLKYECYVPAGKFIMGDDTGDANERPAHEVYVAAFYDVYIRRESALER